MTTKYSKATNESFTDAVYTSWLKLNQGGVATIQAITEDMQITPKEFEDSYISLGFNAGFELFASRNIGKNLVIINNRRVSHLMFHNR
jgi:hypothetical protein